MSKDKRIVLVHGWGARAEKLEPLAKALEKLGWKVLNLELPGFGLVEPNGVWGLSEYSDLVDSIRLKAWGNKPFVFFGHSNGGRIGIKTALKNESGLGGLVLCAPGGWSNPNRLKKAVFGCVAKVGRALFGENVLGRKLLYKLARVHDYEKATPKMREVFKKIVDEDVRKNIAGINVSTLVLWGSEDRMVAVEDGKKAVKEIKLGQMEIYNGEGHRLPYNQPEWVAERIDKWFGLSK